MTFLGMLGGTASEALGINACGQIVGDVTTSTGNNHAFLYSGGTMTDLNDLIAPSSGWTLQQANATNDCGQICGYGTNPAGQTHAFLLTPTPEPSTLILLAIGAISFLAYRRRSL
jgi:probable HAF family extracellular repeat protein